MNYHMYLKFVSNMIAILLIFFLSSISEQSVGYWLKFVGLFSYQFDRFQLIHQSLDQTEWHSYNNYISKITNQMLISFYTIEYFTIPNLTITWSYISKTCFFNEKPSVSPFTTQNIWTKIITPYTAIVMKTTKTITTGLTRSCWTSPFQNWTFFAFNTKSSNKRQIWYFQKCNLQKIYLHILPHIQLFLWLPQ